MRCAAISLAITCFIGFMGGSAQAGDFCPIGPDIGGQVGNISVPVGDVNDIRLTPGLVYRAVRMRVEFDSKLRSEWSPALTFWIVDASQKDAILVFRQIGNETHLSTQTYSGNADGSRDLRQTLGYTPPLKGSLLTEVDWSPSGTVTYKVFNTDQGFGGSYLSYRFEQGAPTDFIISVSTADADFKSIQFGQPCPAS